MTLTIDIVARITVVVLAIIFSIAFKRRKALFTVKNTARDAQAALLEGGTQTTSCGCAAGSVPSRWRTAFTRSWSPPDFCMARLRGPSW